ncbi:MAG TPA: ATP-binding protein, partial [Candidatus Tectomicrobia bacterium]
TGIGGVMVFHPVRVGIQRLLDKYCYREPYDYRQATRTMSQVLAGLVRLAPLCEYLTTFIFSTLRVEVVAVYVYHAPAVLERCACQSTSDDHDLPHILRSEPAVLTGVARVREPMLRDELGRWEDSHLGNSLAEVFASLQSNVLIPLVVEDNVAALITVGGKLSGDPFFVHDLELLSTVGHQASVALRRAQLYEEITWMKEYNESILRQMESGVVAVSHQGVITMMNAAAARLLRVEVTQAASRAFAEILPESLSVPLIHTLAGRATYVNQEATLPVPTGCQLPIALSTSVLHRAAGELTGAILVFHDLSRLKALEEEKNRVERLASIGTFMSGIAHEIKNPLVAIKTLAELLPEQYDDAEFRETFTRVALHEVERIDTLVYRLRSMGSSSSWHMRLMSVLPPLDETLGLISGELIKRHITLAYEKHERLPPLMGDHDQLKQVFLNLCLNSIEAMEKDGTLRIALGVDYAPDATAAALLIDISDTGPGIPVEYLPTIFEPFVTSKDTGSGLGLAICKGIIEYHRGTLSVANRADGPGAIFTLRLPVAQEEEPYAVSAAHRQALRAAGAMA